jgi:hypothetical protein
MASGGITGKAFSLEALFHGRVTYAIEYYQREYAWGPDEVSTLITDLVGEFERTSGSRRSRWAPPVQYFLGPFVYADEDGDRRFLVDGQQRFTTLHLIFLHLLRLAPDDTRPKTRHRLTNAVVAGYDGDQPRFLLDIDERRRAMNALLNGQAFEPRLGDSLTVQNLWRRSEQIREDLAQRIQSDQHARFVDWLLDNVVMVGIEATDRDSGFRIFESMNDRGARLTSVDLMKSFLLSRANRDVEKLNSLWRDMIREVTRQRGDADAPKEFLKAYLIGRHANLADDSDDVQQINDAPHIWARDHTADIGLAEEGEAYHRFVSELIDLGHAYGNMAAATIHPFDINERAALYYNRVNGVTAQMALILASVHRGDQDSVINEKARIAANFVDLLVVLRAVNDESTRPDDPNRDVLSAVTRVRTCTSTAELSAVLGEQLPELSFDQIPTFGLRGDNRAQVRYVLARLTAYIEKAMGNADAVNSPIRTWTRTRPKLRDKPLADGDDAVTVTAAISGPTLLHPVRIHASTTADTPQNRPASTDACRLWSVAQPAPAEQPRTPSHSPTAGARPPSRSPTPPPGSTDVVAGHCRPRLRAADAGQRECIRTIEQGCELSSDGRTQPTRDRCYACFVPAVRAVV